MISVKRKFVIIAALLLAGISFIRIYHLFIKDFDNNVIYKGVSQITSESAEDSFTFAVMGDNKNSISTFKTIISDINNQNRILFTMNTGDMVFDGNPVKYDFFLNQLKLFTNPMLPAPGNHDVADGGIDRYINIFGPLYYSFSFGSTLFIILDDSNEKDIDPWQMQWFRKELEKSKNYKHTFIFMHVPIYDPRKSIDTQPGHSLKDLSRAEHLLNLIKKYHVDMVFAGHIHGYFRGDWEGVPYTITGGGGAEMLLSDPDHYFYHYIEVTVNDSGINYRTVKIDSPDFNITDRIGAFLWIYLYSFIIINYWSIMLFLALGTIILFLLKQYKEEFVFSVKRKEK